MSLNYDEIIYSGCLGDIMIGALQRKKVWQKEEPGQLIAYTWRI
jgi:hypothetical protein